jgi:hypothetical protein
MAKGGAHLAARVREPDAVPDAGEAVAGAAHRGEGLAGKASGEDVEVRRDLAISGEVIFMQAFFFFYYYYY